MTTDLWAGFEGPQGSVIAYFAIHRGDGADFSDFVLNNVMNPVAELPHPLKWGIGTVGAKVPAGVAQILASARVVHCGVAAVYRSAPSRPKPRRTNKFELGPDRAGLATHRRQRFPDTMWRSIRGTQVVFFSPYNADSSGRGRPTDNSTNGAIPEALSGRSLAATPLR